jgi:hypothetical protein
VSEQTGDTPKRRRRATTDRSEETANNPALAEQQETEPERQEKVDGEPAADTAAGDASKGEWSGAATTDRGDAGQRGPLSPAQFDDDGWGDTPAQMRDLPRT